jgi:hypothetical protein
VSDERLPAHVEVAGILRRAQASGDFGTVLRKGDPDRGSLILVVTSRGDHIAILERVLDLNEGYVWRRSEASESSGSINIVNFLARRARFDEDLWAVELDIAEPERFIAETTGLG